MDWVFEPPLDASHRAALTSGNHLVCVGPPAAWTVASVLSRLPPASALDTPPVVVLAPDTADAADLAAVCSTISSLAPALAVTGIARAERLLLAGIARTVVLAPSDALDLVRRAVLKLPSTPTIALVWPEVMLAAGEGGTLDTLLAEAGAVQRVVFTATPDDLTDLVERHARRAPVAILSRPAAAPTVSIRYACIDTPRRSAAVRAVLDQWNPATAVLWDPPPYRLAGFAPQGSGDPTVLPFGETGERTADLAIATDLPSAEVLVALAAQARDVVVLVRSSQQPYLQRLAATLRPQRLPSEADRARNQARVLRDRLRARLDRGNLTGALSALDPLFDLFDPALVAAAAAAELTADPAVGIETAPSTPAAAGPAAASRIRVRLDQGRRDGLRPGDVMGVLLNHVGVAKDHVGRIDIRDGFTLVEVPAHEAETVVRGLAGASIRGRRVSARVERR
ncbi:MAG TPA: DbpA RNA binding domain-containing protein [Gemmatimonadales bacterium]